MTRKGVVTWSLSSWRSCMSISNYP